MDILKYGPDVEVLQPARLRQRVRQLLGEALQRYRQGARFADLLDMPKRTPAQSAGTSPNSCALRLPPERDRCRPAGRPPELLWCRTSRRLIA